MDSAEDDWLANSTAIPGPSLEDFLATNPSQLPFLQERPPTAEEDFVRYQIFAEDWGSIEHLQQVSNRLRCVFFLERAWFVLVVFLYSYVNAGYLPQAVLLFGTCSGSHGSKGSCAKASWRESVYVKRVASL